MRDGSDAEPVANDAGSSFDGAAGSDGAMSSDASPDRPPASDAATPPPSDADVDASLGSDDAGGGGGTIELGRRCADDSSCITGYCYDVSLANPFCFGQTCTIACDGWETCDAYARSLGYTATTSSCVRHGDGVTHVCDFSMSGPPIDVACE